jgi:TM2 domain-containing membrane protein YozV
MLKGLPRGEAILPLLLVALLALMFVASPLADMGVVRRPLVGMIMVIVVLSGLLALGRSGRLALPVVGTGLLLLGLQSAEVVAGAPRFPLLVGATAALFVIVLSSVLLLGVCGAGRITIHRIIGAVVVYLLIGLLFAILFDVTERLAPGAFVMGPNPAERASTGSQFFYLSMITLTSVGFGDMAPVHPFARALVMLEAVVGQIYTTVLLAWLVSLEIANRRS